jgi:hypothetical protein
VSAILLSPVISIHPALSLALAKANAYVYLLRLRVDVCLIMQQISINGGYLFD